MEIKTKITFNIKTKLRCPSCNAEFSFTSDSPGAAISGRCPRCGALCDVRNAGKINDAIRDAVTKNIPPVDASGQTEGQPANPAIAEPFDEAEYQGLRRLTMLLNAVAIIIDLWGIFVPIPYATAIIANAAVPLIAILIMIVYRGGVRLDPDRKSKAAHLTYAIVAPSMAIGLRAFDFHIFSLKDALVYVLIISVPLTFLIYQSASPIKKRLWKALIFFPFMFVYGFGLVVETNCLLDRSTPTIYKTRVADKYVSRGRRSTTYYLTLTPWEQTIEGNRNMTVSRKVFQRAQINDDMTIAIKGGKLGIPWYDVEPAPQEETTP